MPGPNWEEQEVSDYCAIHNVEFFGSCPKCYPAGNGEIVKDDLNLTISEIARGLPTESWDEWVTEQQYQAQQQMDQDDEYIESVCDGKGHNHSG